MPSKLPVYRCDIRQRDNTGIFAVSFVEMPAIERNFVALTAQKKPVKLALDRQKQVLTGALLVPDQLIYRNDAALGEYYMTFTASDIENIAHKMMRTSVALEHTTHQHSIALNGNHLVEAWVVVDSACDKSVALGLGEHPKGTLMVSYKVADAKYWREEVMTGNVKGFSLEGIFNFNTIKMAKPTTTPAAAKAGANATSKGGRLSTFFNAISALLEGDPVAEADALADEAKKDEVQAGTPFLIFELADGGEVCVDSEGFATLDGEQMAAGEHALADGNFIVIDDAGLLVVTQPEAGGTDPESPAAQLAKQTAAAKARAKLYLSKSGDGNARKIATLKAQIAKLEKEPSTGKAEPRVSAADKPFEAMTRTERMAAVLRAQQERKKINN